jgi:hypothetical protein
MYRCAHIAAAAEGYEANVEIILLLDIKRRRRWEERVSLFFFFFPNSTSKSSFSNDLAVYN